MFDPQKAFAESEELDRTETTQKRWQEDNEHAKKKRKKKESVQ
ncbi:hypothetical protein [Nibrella viscosa]